MATAEQTNLPSEGITILMGPGSVVHADSKNGVTSARLTSPSASMKEQSITTPKTSLLDRLLRRK